VPGICPEGTGIVRRMLIAQSQMEDVALVTDDEASMRPVRRPA
jgi:hypothetical protein